MRLDGSRDESEAEVGQGRFFRRWEEKRFSKGRTAERAARSTTSRHFRSRELVSHGIPATPTGQLRTSIRQIERAGYHYDPILWSSLRIAWIISIQHGAGYNEVRSIVLYAAFSRISFRVLSDKWARRRLVKPRTLFVSWLFAIHCVRECMTKCVELFQGS